MILGNALPKATIFVFGIIVGSIAGWVISKHIAPVDRLDTLRLPDDGFTSPLLACDMKDERKEPQLENLEKELQEYINKEVSTGKMKNISVYFRDYAFGSGFSVNENDLYAPASLIKVPLMIAAYKQAQASPAFLDQQMELEIVGDINHSQEIVPSESIKPGDVYTVDEIINLMIKYSDNNPVYILLENYIDKEIYLQAYNDMRIPSTIKVEGENVVNIDNYSYFFRVLYNATYLDRKYSEKALELLASTDYNRGLVAGVPKDIKVAHKYGLRGKLDKKGDEERQLHDCGLIYYPQKPYLLCIMTKSLKSIEEIEAVIKTISEITYKEVDRYRNASPHQ